MTCNCQGYCSCGCESEQPINVIEQAVNDALAGRIDELNGYSESAKDSADAAKVSETNAEGYAEETKGYRDQTETIYQDAQALVPEILEASQNVEDAANAVNSAIEIASSVAVVRYEYTIVGGETSITVPSTYVAKSVQSIDVEGYRQYPGHGYSYDASTQVITMDEAFDTDQAGTVAMLFLGTLNADSPETVYSNLASASGATLIGTAGNVTVQEALDAIDVVDAQQTADITALQATVTEAQPVIDNAVLGFSTVADAVAFTGFKNNQKVRTLKYNVDVVTDWLFTTAEPASPTFYISVTSGGYLTLLTANFASAGLISSDTYTAADAWANRNLINQLCQDTRFKHLSFGKAGTYWILGSICPNRHYFTIEIEAGVDVVGRLEDSTITASVSNNTGGMFDMTLRENYLVTGDMTNTGILYNSNIILNGSVKTVYDASHLQLHNNNCIGYYNTVDCSVVGTGGVKGSDHRGINFDGDSVNARIDIAYACGTMDEPLCMHVKSTAYGLVRVGSIYDVPFGGISGLTIAVRPTGGTIDVYIGSFVYNGTTKPVLVSAYNAEEVNAYIGYANGITYALRGYETKRIKLHGGRYLNAAYMAGRAGVNTGRTEEIMVEGVKVLDNQVTTAVYCETNQDTFNKITVKDCDFSLCPTTFLYVRSMTTAGAAKVVTLLNNNSPTVSGWTGAYLNLLPGAISASLVSSGATSFAYNYKQPDYNYAYITAVVTVSGVNYPVEISTLVRGQGTITLTYTAGAATLAVTISGTTITGTVTGGTLTAVYAHN